MARRAPGKYDKVIHKLKPLQPGATATTGHQDRVDLKKAELRGHLPAVTSDALVNHYAGIKADIKQRIDETRRHFAENDGTVLACSQLYRELRRAQNIAKAITSDVNVLLDAVTQLLVDLQEQGAPGFGEYGAAPNAMRFTNGDSLRTAPEPYTVTENPDALREYFISSGMTRLLSPPWQTVNSLNKDRLLEGEPELPGTRLYLKTGIVFTENKPEKRADVASAESEL